MNGFVRMDDALERVSDAHGRLRDDVPPKIREAAARLLAQPYVDTKRSAVVALDAPLFRQLLDRTIAERAGAEFRALSGPPLRMADVSRRPCGLSEPLPWYGVAAVAGADRASTDEARGLAVCTILGDRLHACFDVADATLRIRPLGERFHAFYRVDPDGLPRYAHPTAHVWRRVDEPAGRSREPGGSPGPDAPVERDRCKRVVIDVAVAFTPEAMAELRALTPAAADLQLQQDFAQARLDQANGCFDESGIRVHLRLAATTEAGVTEAVMRRPGMSAVELGVAMLDLTDARMAPVIDWWATTPAQSLVLIGELGGHASAASYGGSTRAAWVPVFEQSAWKLFNDPPSAPGFRGYSIVNRVAAENHLSFVHEIGHQLGMQHETGRRWGGAVKLIARNPLALVDTGRGFVHDAPRCLSIMSIGDGVNDRGRRFPVFSRSAPYPPARTPVPGLLQWGDATTDNVALANRLAEHFARRRPPGP